MTTKTSVRSLAWTALAVAAALCSSGAAFAQADVAALPEIVVDRDTDGLRVDIRPRPDTDIVDTAMVFTSTNNGRAAVRCVARDRSGTAIGRTKTEVPANGVKYILASDFANGRDFVGHVQCWTNAHFIPTAIFLGPEITDLPTRKGSHEGRTNIRFPLVATY